MSALRRFKVGGSDSRHTTAHSIIAAVAADDTNDPHPHPQQQPRTPAMPTQGIRIEQFVRHVIDFSSQYGSDSSISFTAQNITGKPSKFPCYGDFPETFAMVWVVWVPISTAVPQSHN